MRLSADRSSRRRWLASGLAVVTVAAVGGVIGLAGGSSRGAVVAGSSGGVVAAGPPADRPITIATSSWKPGDGAWQALSSGVLRATPEGCPYLVSPDPRARDRTALVWPAGYSARYAARDGKVEVIAPDGSVVVREGNTLSVGGGSLPLSGKPCTSGAKNVFLIMDDLTR